MNRLGNSLTFGVPISGSFTSSITFPLSGQGWPRLALGCLSYNVPGLPNPQSRARHLRLCPSANAAPGQGLGGESVANAAGNPVLYEGQPHPACHDGKQGACRATVHLHGSWQGYKKIEYLTLILSSTPRVRQFPLPSHLF